MATNQDYCGIVFIGGGTSWAYAGSIDEAAKRAAKYAKQDWRTLFKFKRRHEFSVNVYDTSKHNGWVADYSGVHGVIKGKRDDAPLPLIKTVQVTV